MNPQDFQNQQNFNQQNAEMNFQMNQKSFEEKVANNKRIVNYVIAGLTLVLLGLNFFSAYKISASSSLASLFSESDSSAGANFSDINVNVFNGGPVFLVVQLIASLFFGIIALEAALNGSKNFNFKTLSIGIVAFIYVAISYLFFTSSSSNTEPLSIVGLNVSLSVFAWLILIIFFVQNILISLLVFGFNSKPKLMNNYENSYNLNPNLGNNFGQSNMNQNGFNQYYVPNNNLSNYSNSQVNSNPGTNQNQNFNGSNQNSNFSNNQFTGNANNTNPMPQSNISDNGVFNNPQSSSTNSEQKDSSIEENKEQN